MHTLDGNLGVYIGKVQAEGCAVIVTEICQVTKIPSTIDPKQIVTGIAPARDKYIKVFGAILSEVSAETLTDYQKARANLDRSN